MREWIFFHRHPLLSAIGRLWHSTSCLLSFLYFNLFLLLSCLGSPANRPPPLHQVAPCIACLCWWGGNISCCLARRSRRRRDAYRDAWVLEAGPWGFQQGKGRSDKDQVSSHSTAISLSRCSPGQSSRPPILPSSNATTPAALVSLPTSQSFLSHPAPSSSSVFLSYPLHFRCSSHPNF